MRRLKSAAVIGALALALTACSSDTEEASADDVLAVLVDQGIAQADAEKMVDQYEEALKGERTINFYGLAALPLEGTFEKFEKAFPGLDVVGTQLNAPDTSTRVTAEASSGQVNVGVVSGVVETFGQLAPKGYFEKFEPSNADSINEIARDEGGFWAYALTPWGSVYSADKGAEAAPTSWKTLIGAGYDGSVAAVDPKVTGLTQGLMVYLLDAGVIDEADVKAFGASGYTPYADSGATTNAVGTGDKDLVVANSYAVMAAQAKASGFDLGFSFPMSDANITQSILLAKPKNAPNSVASDLLLDYLFQTPAQEDAAAQGYLPVLDGVTSEKFGALNEVVNPITGPSSTDVLDVYGRWTPVLKNAF